MQSIFQPNVIKHDDPSYAFCKKMYRAKITMTLISRMTTNKMRLKPLELDALDGSLGRRLLSSRLQGRAGHAASDGRELNIAGGENSVDVHYFSILQRSSLNFHFSFLIITHLFHLHMCKLGKPPPLPHPYWQQNPPPKQVAKNLF